MRIFLSSTTYDLYDVRAFVIHELEKDGHEVVCHENATFPVHFGHSHDECLEAVKKCDVVVCILDRRYGGSYRGAGAPEIVDQEIEIKYQDGTGQPAVELATVKASELSITWCELITAFSAKMPVMTFARKRMLDEKETRRRNQENKDFRPAYVEKTAIFDLVDWITKQPRSNWIAGFDSIVDLRSMLLRWSAALKSEFLVNRAAKDKIQIPASHVAILVEGEADRQFVRYVIQKLNLPSFFATTCAGGSGAMVRRLARMLESQYEKAYDRVVVLADADSMEYFAPLQARLAEAKNVHLVFAKPELEAWLAAGLDQAFYAQNHGQITKDLFIKKFGRNRIPLLSTQLANYDIDAAKSLVPELSQFIRLISDFDGNVNGGDIAKV